MLKTKKITVVIIIVITSAILCALLIFYQDDSLISLHPEPMITPGYLGSLSSVKIYAGADLRVPG